MQRGVCLDQERQLSELAQQGLIQGFAFTHELAWNLFKDYLQHQFVRLPGAQAPASCIRYRPLPDGRSEPSAPAGAHQPRGQLKQPDS
jgi:hypothetical protein